MKSFFLDSLVGGISGVILLSLFIFLSGYINPEDPDRGFIHMTLGWLVIDSITRSWRDRWNNGKEKI